MQGTAQMAVDDVWGIGKAIGVKFNGDNVNMFRVLSRAGKGKKESSCSQQGGGARHERLSYNLVMCSWVRPSGAIRLMLFLFALRSGHQGVY
ncbi:hypothetical protein L195_g054560 [Trifolium pratense]|uniref:Sulfate transporter n=1 Tax=Trifolium pratense TaxID=57577 RepID=A0A2K3KGT3_TRIPR|nr:hypothetical protein L195_g054560 [Trifolium pratense]